MPLPLMRPRRGRRPLLAPLFLVLGAAAPGAAAPEPSWEVSGRLGLETERVVVLKDGHGLFVKRARGMGDDRGQVWVEEVPEAAVLGSFWALAPEDRPLLSMSAAWVETVETRETAVACITIPELLRVNVGRRLKLELTDDRVVHGVLAQVLDRAAGAGDPTVARPAAAAALAASGSRAYRILGAPPAATSLPPGERS